MDNDKRRNEVEKIYTEYIKKMQSIEQKILRVKGADERLEYIERQVNGGIEAEAKERAAARGSSINPEHAKFLRAFLLKDKEEIKELQKLKPDDFKKEMEDARKQFDKKMEQYKGVKPLITSYDLGMIWNIAQKPLNSLEKKLQKSSDQQPKNPAEKPNGPLHDVDRRHIVRDNKNTAMVSSIVKSLSTLLDKIKRDGEKLNQTQIKQEVWKMIRKENPNVSEKDFDKLYDKAQELANDSRFQRKQRIDIPVEQRINIPIDDTKKMVSAAISGIDQKVLKDAMSQMSIPGRSVENFTSKYGLNKPANHEERQNNNKSNPPTHLSK